MLNWFKKTKKPSGVKIDFIERDDLHTRLTISLSQIMKHDPNMGKIRLQFKIYDKEGALKKRWSSDHEALANVILDSKKFRPVFENPKTFHLPVPFSGDLEIECKNRDLIENGVTVEYYRE